MQLAGAGDDLPVRRDADGGVVAEPSVVRSLVQRRGHEAAGVLGKPAGETGGPAVGNGLHVDSRRPGCRLARGEVGRQRELLQAHDLSAMAGGEPHSGDEGLFVDTGIVLPRRLHRTHLQRITSGGCHAGR